MSLSFFVKGISHVSDGTSMKFSHKPCTLLHRIDFLKFSMDEKQGCVNGDGVGECLEAAG